MRKQMIKREKILFSWSNETSINYNANSTSLFNLNIANLLLQKFFLLHVQLQLK